jgi:demethylmenaquinone methyltransferase/2-methoxy-6-polyprenyl-1,4-benzoquinol methylase
MSGRRLYDRWSRNPWALRGLYGLAFLGRERTFRRRSVAALELSAGDRVLEVGCGPGNSFRRLREAVGPDGRVVGVDYSRGMVEGAADRIEDAGWENVHVVHGDATTPGIRRGTFDAVYASMSISAMPNPVTAIDAAARCLRADGRIAVLDARPFQGVWRVLNPAVVPVLRVLTDWDHETDVPAAIESRFETATVRGYNAGTIYVASGTGPRADARSEPDLPTSRE